MENGDDDGNVLSSDAGEGGKGGRRGGEKLQLPPCKLCFFFYPPPHPRSMGGGGRGVGEKEEEERGRVSPLRLLSERYAIKLGALKTYNTFV